MTTLKRVRGGWLNRVGLRNGGVKSIPNSPDIISISSLEEGDWDILLEELDKRENVIGVELNISCPNAIVKSATREVIEKSKLYFPITIVKVPHNADTSFVFSLIEIGASILHISNTKRTDQGSLSGIDLIDSNLDMIREIKKFYPEVKIIGGGGIYNLETLLRYKEAGADYFSLSTLLINPFKTYRLIRDFYKGGHDA